MIGLLDIVTHAVIIIFGVVYGLVVHSIGYVVVAMLIGRFINEPRGNPDKGVKFLHWTLIVLVLVVAAIEILRLAGSMKEFCSIPNESMSTALIGIPTFSLIFTVWLVDFHFPTVQTEETKPYQHKRGYFVFATMLSNLLCLIIIVGYPTFIFGCVLFR